MFTRIHFESPAAKRTAVIILLLAAALLVLAVCRAVLIPLTHDEAVSLAMFSTKSIGDILSFEGAGGMPNNHILNTLWLKFASAASGDSTLSLRMGNILALIIYLYAAARLSFVLRPPLLRISGFILLCANPFVFDFFSLARGYGMANGFLLLSTWMLYQWWMHPSQRKAYAMLISAALMVLANFSAVHVYVAFVCILIAAGIYRSETKTARTFVRAFLPPAVVSMVLGALLYLPFNAIRQDGGSFGGETGFWQDCAIWLMSFTTYGKSYAMPVMQFLPWFVMLLVAGMIISAALFTLQRKKSFLLFCVPLLLLPVLTMQFQHLLLGTEFPVARTVQYMYPLFIVCVAFFLNEWNKMQRVATAFGALSAVLLSAHFLNCMQCTYVAQWQYDAANRKVLSDLEEIWREEHEVPVRLGITWIFEPGLNYERVYSNRNWLHPLNREGTAKEYDYYYVISEDSALLALRGKKVLRFYPESNTSLMK